MPDSVPFTGCSLAESLERSHLSLGAGRGSCLDVKGARILVLECWLTRALAAAGGVLGFSDFAKRSAYEGNTNTPPAATQDLVGPV